MAGNAGVFRPRSHARSIADQLLAVLVRLLDQPRSLVDQPGIVAELAILARQKNGHSRIVTRLEAPTRSPYSATILPATYLRAAICV